MFFFSKTNKKICFWFLLAALAFLGSNAFLFDEKPGFSIDNILQKLPMHANWLIDKKDRWLDGSSDKILNQPFIYLGQGKQSFVFESQDGKYVIKFLKTRRVREKRWFYYWQNWLKFSTPLPWIKYYLSQRELIHLCDRYVLAFKEFSKESALVHIHFNRGKDLCKSIGVTDMQGFNHDVDLDIVPFVIQKKVELVPEYFRKLSKRARPGDMAEAVASLQHLLVSRTLKGLTDARQVFSKNYGFLDGRAIQIDVGKIRKMNLKKESAEKELTRILNNLNGWIGRHYPGMELEINPARD